MTRQYYISKLQKEGKIKIYGNKAARMIRDEAQAQGLDFGWEYDSIHGWTLWMN